MLFRKTAIKFFSMFKTFYNCSPIQDQQYDDSNYLKYKTNIKKLSLRVIKLCEKNLELSCKKKTKKKTKNKKKLNLQILNIYFTGLSNENLY